MPISNRNGTSRTGPTLLIRADGDAHIGGGHVMRCLALAQWWQKEAGPVEMAATTVGSAMKALIQGQGIDIHQVEAKAGSPEDARQTIEIAHHTAASAIVLDGYHFSNFYQQLIGNAGSCVLVVDDTGGLEAYTADVVLNQNIHATEELYRSKAQRARLLLGPRYALLRQEFWPFKNWRRTCRPEARRILVTLGGGDTLAVALTVVRALQKLTLNDLEVRVAVGAADAQSPDIQQEAKRVRGNCEILPYIESMTTAMQWADVAVSAGGSTCWELAYMGLPSLTIILADNQRQIAEGLARAGISQNLGWHNEMSQEAIAENLSTLLTDVNRRQLMSENGRQLIDGVGVARVTSALQGNLT